MPNYAAERRLDGVINLFLEDILSAEYKEKVTYVAPEFPIIYKQDSKKKVKYIDYLCSTHSGDILLVELKTDRKSFNKGQLDIYLKNNDWKNLINRLKDRVKHERVKSDDKLKYLTLLTKLLEHGLVAYIETPSKIPEVLLRSGELPKKEKGQRSSHIIKAFDNIKAKEGLEECKLVYLGPRILEESLVSDYKDRIKFICFDDLGSLDIKPKFLSE